MAPPSSLHTKFKIAAKIAAPPPREAIRPLKRTLVVRRVEVNRLVEINIMEQKFHAEFVIQLSFDGGALDENLIREGNDFPLDGWGRPTFRPSAGWYMAQIDFNNALEYKTLDAKIMKDGDDMLMNLRFEATFAQTLELHDFPCDVQALTMSLAFNCRMTGMMPVEIVTSPELATGIANEGFVDWATWSLYPELEVKPGTVGTKADRMFPSIEIVAHIRRRPTFFILNVAAPVFLFVPMALLQFAASRDNVEGRLGVSMAIVLTTIAHKYSISTLVPPVAYLTALDKYVFSSLLLITFITFQGGLIGALESAYCRTQAVVLPANETAGASPGGRMLVAAASGATMGFAVSGTGAAAADAQEVAYYRDPDCPYNRMLEFNKFDLIDLVLLGMDLCLWILLQAWAVLAYARVQRKLSQRMAESRAAQERQREDAEKRLAALKPKEGSFSFQRQRRVSIVPSALKRMATRSRLNRTATSSVLKRQGTQKCIPLERTKTSTGLQNFAHLANHSRPAAYEGEDRFAALERAVAASKIQAQARGKRVRLRIAQTLLLSQEKRAPSASPLRVAAAARPNGCLPRLSALTPARTAPNPLGSAQTAGGADAGRIRQPAALLESE